MLYTAHYQSKFGWFQIKGSYLGIQSIKLVDEKGEDSYPMPEILISCVQQLDEYFHRKRQEFKLHLDWEGKSAFHQAVWKELLKIPYGHTTTYSAIAEKLDNPQAVRAVGLANRNNPIAIVVPCHRVIAKNGDLQGYFYGLDMKRQLLEIENPMSFARQGTLF